jgi:hypothetical protein
MPSPKRRHRRSCGRHRRMRSGRFQASDTGPDGRRHNAPTTFDTHGDADARLAAEHVDIARDDRHRPVPPRPAVESFGPYARAWLERRELPRTRFEYRKLLEGHLLETFRDPYLDDITAAIGREWYGRLGKRTGPTRWAHAHGLLKAILAAAVADEVIDPNPCRIRGAGQPSGPGRSSRRAWPSWASSASPCSRSTGRRL